MRISYRWLTRLLKKEIPLDELVHTLTMSGLEVESLNDLGIRDGKVVTARILTREPHPNADNLSLCDVETREGEQFRIVCGAKNMQPGDLVPLALEGASLPIGITIKKSKIRGEPSQGMMCSAGELEWGEDSDGLLLLPEESPTGPRYRAGEPFDALLEIKVTPNRSDCLSILGIARDVAAMHSLEPPMLDSLAPPPGSPLPTAEASVTIEAPEACPRYIATLIEGVKVAPSPLWLRRAVESAGFRSINNIVDVTNYILIEAGQPLHAFDLDKLAGEKVVVRMAGDGETVKTLDGQELVLTESDLLIADGEKAVALAGIIGCGNSEISETTTRVLLEGAYFDPTTIRKTSKRIGKSTDSSYRFERGVDWSALPTVMQRAAQLIVQVAGGNISGRGTAGQGLKPASSIEIDLDRINDLLGLKLRVEEMTDPLRRLGFALEKMGETIINVTAPAHRPDVTREADIAEEIARVHGYDNIPAIPPRIRSKPQELSAIETVQDGLRRVLVSSGFLEICNYSFHARESYQNINMDCGDLVALTNPLSGEYSVMRASLIPQMLSTLVYNFNRGVDQARLFEVGKVYLASQDNAVEERWAFAAAMTGKSGNGWRGTKRDLDFYDMRAVAQKIACAFHVPQLVMLRPDGMGENSVLHPGKSAVAQGDGRNVMHLGHLHPAVAEKLEIRREVLLVYGLLEDLTPWLDTRQKIKEAPQFPALTRDLALVADQSVNTADIEITIARRAKALLHSIELFDVYEGDKIADGKRSLAYSLKFSAHDRTLTDEEVNQAIDRVLADLQAKLGVELRG